MTTGMSAPPIGSTTKLPRIAAATSTPRMNTASESVEPAMISTEQATAQTSSSRLSTDCARPSVIGRPGRISWSFPNAMFEPQNEIEPTIAAKHSKTGT